VKEKPKPKPKPKPVKEKPKPVEQKPKPQPKPQPKPIDELSLDALFTEEELSRDLDEIEATTSSKVALLVSKIKLRVGSYWSRPPSARNGMMVSLKVNFLPNGQVASVTVLKSSGDPAFDRSAIRALKQGQPHDYLTEFGLVFFNNNFRSVTLNFRPEDLK